MLFNSVAFFAFLACALPLFHFSPRPIRKYVLLALSYYFYISWVPEYIAVLVGLTLLDYFAALLVERAHEFYRRAAITLSVLANLGLLAYFKYYNFFASNFSANPRLLRYVLPLGISFHTFQSISYVVDVYRGRQRAVRSLPDYALYIAFFPQLVAGPIVRAHDFFADLTEWRRPTAVEVRRGVFLMVLGLFQKMVLADQCAIRVDPYFTNPAGGLLTAWTAAFGFALQIYFDFAGYTDIAIGCALLFGFHFPLNFRRPYLARSHSEFWRRWHISLSQWFRDYLYIPLGGDRRGPFRTSFNLFLTMLLAGFWHGANWTFLAWGAYHGALLVVERQVERRLPKRLTGVAAVAVTFLLTTVGWVFFRAPTLPKAFYILSQMVTGARGTNLLGPGLIVILVAALLLAAWEEHHPFTERLVEGNVWASGAAMAGMLLALELFSVTDTVVPFVYFQF